MKSSVACAILLLGTITSASACLDLTPTVLAGDDAGGQGNSPCYRCLSAPPDPGPGCGDKLATCQAIDACAKAYACTLAHGCFSGTKDHLAICTKACSSTLSSSQDPAVMPAIAVYQCLLAGPCTSMCFPDEVSEAAPEAGEPKESGTDAVAGACLDSSDQAILAAGLGTTPNDCGFACIGQIDATCATMCVQMKSGLSMGCATCWGGVIQCDIQHCLGECLAPDSQTCRDCNTQFCDQDFRACSGS